MRLVLIGATGNLGQWLMKEALADDHMVTAFVRDADKLKSQIGPHVPSSVEIIEGDVADEVALARAIRDQDALISAAGNARDGLAFNALFDQIVTMAEEQMRPGARAWFLAGAGLLRVPGTQWMTLDLPGVDPIERVHLLNYQRLAECSLHWALLCPAALDPTPQPSLTQGLRLSRNEWPVPRPVITRWLPRAATGRAYQAALPTLTIPCQDVARLMFNNLSASSELSHCRIGVALPATSE